MKTAIDTIILLDILIPNDEFYEASARALQDSATEGSLGFLDSNEIRLQNLTRSTFSRAAPGGNIGARAAAGPECWRTF